MLYPSWRRSALSPDFKVPQSQLEVYFGRFALEIETPTQRGSCEACDGKCQMPRFQDKENGMDMGSSSCKKCANAP